jgi:Rrf2 family iron-sulfur cluster assembly transcriptional regulator
LKLSTRSRYGVRLVLDLAQHHREGPVQLGEIARRQEVSQKYLEQIIKPLKRAGIVESIRGAKGGYRLTRPPRKIKVGEVVALLEGGTSICECSDDPTSCSRAATCLTRPLWAKAARSMFKTLDGVSFHDLSTGSWR